MLIVRPARMDDLDAFCALAEASEPGFTTLVPDRDLLAQTIETSRATFGDPVGDKPKSTYLLMLENEEGAVHGCAAVKARVGIDTPIFNFRILQLSQSSAPTDCRFEMDVLTLMNEYTGCAEAGTLFVDNTLRGVGAGRLLANARYMLIAAAPERFGERVISQLRGVVTPEGRSAFWEALGQKFFAMDFCQADRVRATSSTQFMLDLLPKYPIYASLLPSEAQAVIGEVHPKGRPARAMLLDEGFSYDQVIDVFDGGPVVCAPRDGLRTVRESQVLPVTTSTPFQDSDAVDALVCPAAFERYGVGRTRVSLSDAGVSLHPQDQAKLDVTAGDDVRIWVKS